ncbi:alkene reductase [Rhodococcus kroppenstedtii]|uniref:Alkene reductase n=1 Tax=Rhodococcoides kroppenstedtii TaxID=293050 RepID=A0ABS7NXQ7_9NOCA|nr:MULTISPECIES: alkene reductase [Rhodococcus]AMY19875.1 N-ethylmaleimide reductase [Rhodococcus sp. PBTS 1]MBY6315380.1 alkene reductase [Rhodococcus kroppenstedtii]MBY6322829.1 alkene reductase [Rhodococcus kroppenstedtii]MBY6398585.1 alkene reductase [Rhodococcus kroppenstedtii]MDV7196758.1 alkene reductase [Rhodococcus kroppenstedtii]
MSLFSTVTLGDLALRNRLVMAPLTRVRSGPEGIPGPLVAEHYRQRASLGLIVSEGTYPSHAGQGFPGQPGLVTDEQLAGWKAVTDAVHAEGGLIVAQVMHAGRVTHEATTGGHEVVGPSAIAIEGETRTYDGKKPYPVPHALTTDELPSVIEEFVRGSRNAIAAGFDGVEIHSANGYLLHEFLSPASNQRDDAYGGSPENRARFVAEVVEAVVDAIGAGRVGIRISPEHNIQDALETDPADVRATYRALVDRIAPLGLSYLSVLHKDPAGELVQDLRTAFGGPFLVNSGFGEITTRDEALAIVDDNVGDAVVVGRPAIANPDLVHRWKEDLPLNTPDQSTFYSSGAEGYTDYPFASAAR